MGLVNYSDSESEGEEVPVVAELTKTNNNILKRKHTASKPASDLPPLPASFRDLYSSNVRISAEDDPSLHGGRKRAIPHVEGNWPSHVYLEWNPNTTESRILNSLVEHVQKATNSNCNETDPHRVTSLLISDLSTALPLHISLSRSLVLQTAQKESFQTAATSGVQKSAVRPFQIAFTSLKWVPNHERTRYFLVAGIERPRSDELNRLLEFTNRAAASLDLGTLYDNESPVSSPKGKRARRSSSQVEISDRTDCFHVSLAWALKPPTSEARDASNLDGDTDLTSQLRRLQVEFDSVKIKIGNLVTSVPLKTAHDTRRGILG